jgi:hypothetical protein
MNCTVITSMVEDAFSVFRAMDVQRVRLKARGRSLSVSAHVGDSAAKGILTLNLPAKVDDPGLLEFRLPGPIPGELPHKTHISVFEEKVTLTPILPITDLSFELKLDCVRNIEDIEVKFDVNAGRAAMSMPDFLRVTRAASLSADGCLVEFLEDFMSVTATDGRAIVEAVAPYTGSDRFSVELPSFAAPIFNFLSPDSNVIFLKNDAKVCTMAFYVNSTLSASLKFDKVALKIPKETVAHLKEARPKMTITANRRELCAALRRVLTIQPRFEITTMELTPNAGCLRLKISAKDGVASDAIFITSVTDTMPAKPVNFNPNLLLRVLDSSDDVLVKLAVEPTQLWISSAEPPSCNKENFQAIVMATKL